MERYVGEEIVICNCGQEMIVILAACGYVNCPACGVPLKVGACD